MVKRWLAALGVSLEAKKYDKHGVASIVVSNAKGL